MWGKCWDSWCSPYIYIPAHLSANRVICTPDMCCPLPHSKYYNESDTPCIFPSQEMRYPGNEELGVRTYRDKSLNLRQEGVGVEGYPGDSSCSLCCIRLNGRECVQGHCISCSRYHILYIYIYIYIYIEPTETNAINSLVVIRRTTASISSRIIFH